MNRHRMLTAAFVAALVTAAPAPWAQAQGDFTRLSSRYAAWAGGKSNADALVTGLRSGSSITLVTTAPDRSVSLAGFTPSAPMSYDAVSGALSSAQQTLARAGITRPTAEQIQAALIGGEVNAANGVTRQLAGVVGARGAAPSGPVALR